MRLLVLSDIPDGFSWIMFVHYSNCLNLDEELQHSQVQFDINRETLYPTRSPSDSI